MYEFIKSDPPALRSGTLSVKARAGRQGVSLDVYDRQLKIYRAADQFIRKIVRDANITMKEISELSTATDEALFLFDQEFDAYIFEAIKKAVRLYSVDMLLEREPVGPKRTSIVSERYDLLTWFTDQIAGLRKNAYPAMRVTDA